MVDAPPLPLVGRGWGWGGVTHTQGIKNDLDHAIGIPVHIRIPEPQHPITLPVEPGVPRRIARRAMLAAVDLDHQFPAEIGEIGDEGADGRLPASFEIVFGHAWKPEPRQIADGRAVIRFQSR